MNTVEEFGCQGYQRAIWNDFKGAIAIFDKAIAKYPTDVRLYNNRCYCYLRLRDYERALAEADYMIKAFPTYSKSYYRKAEVLIAVRELREAELILREFLKLEPSNEEVKCLHTEVQILLLRKNCTYLVQDILSALQLTKFNTEQAKAFLEMGGMNNSYNKSDIYYSEDESDESSASAPAVLVASEDKEYDPYIDPKNPYKCSSIWVGNVTNKITEEVLKPIFSKYGKIKNIIVQQHNFCAFVNYMDYNMAANAMKKFQHNYPVADTTLIIRFPDNAKAANMIFGSIHKSD